MDKDYSKLFNKQGYILLKEYIDDINRMRKYGPWRLPLRVIDYVHFYFLMFVEKFSWFSGMLYIRHAISVSPAYSILFSYLKKKDLFDDCREGNLHFRGYYSFYLEKRFEIEGEIFKISGQGISGDQSVAFSKALGEFLERSITGVNDTNQNIKNFSCLEINNKKHYVFFPPKYHRFLDVQKVKYKVLNYDPSKKIDWVIGKNLITGEDAYIPRQITLWFKQDFSTDHIFYNSTTNGSAGYFTKEGAVLRALLEVVQRDAFLVHWLTMIPPQTISQDTLPNEIKTMIKEFKMFGISLYILNTTSIQIPSVVVVAINEQSEIPQVFVTGGTALNFFEAITAAITEMIIGVEMFYFEDKEIESRFQNNFVPEPFVSNIGQIERQLYWRGKEKVEKFKWFLSGKIVSYQDVSSHDIPCVDSDEIKLSKCLDILKERGEGYYPVVYFPKNIIQEELGYYIAQVFIPKAFPFYLSEYFGTFDSDRLVEFALSKNIKNWKLNQSPHMFS